MKKQSDPYKDNRIYHKAKLISPDGGISPLCAEKPRRLDLRKELWTITDNAVTCRKCLKKIEENER